MKKGIIITTILIIAAIVGYMMLLEAEVIRNYKIKEFDIVANVDKSGDMRVTEETEYRFNGKYNGITITLPEKVSKDYYGNMTKNSINSSIFKDELYNNEGIEDVSIYVVRNGQREKLSEVGSARLGQDGIYTVSRDSNGYITYKIYEPSKNENKTFVIEYTLKNVALKHNDVAEVFWNFVGGNVECKIENLNISLSLSSGNLEDVYIHGNESGKIEDLNKNLVKVNYKQVGKREFVGVRAVFPTSSIVNSKKLSNQSGASIIKEQEDGYKEKSNIRITLNVVTIIITSGLLFYWLYLLIRYEKDILYKPSDFDEISMLEKYNPIISACIAQNRDMHPRDILAALIDLVNREVLTLKSYKKINEKSGKEEVNYELKKNQEFFKDREKVANLDDIDNCIIDIFFGDNGTIELNRRLRKMQNDTPTVKKINKLDSIVTDKLEQIGANFVRVPNWILTINNILFVLIAVYVMFVVFVNISLSYSTNTTASYEMGQKAITAMYNVFYIFIVALPLVALFAQLVTGFAVLLKNKVDKVAFKISGKKLTQTLVLLVILFVIVFAFESLFVHQSHIIICTILIMIALTIISTDNLMSSHSLKARNDYFYLKAIQDKIENGSLLDEKGIENQILWDRYLSFAIALGVGNVASMVAKIPDINDLMSEFDNNSDRLYDIYTRSRNDNFRIRVERITDAISSASSEFSSGSGGSSFGGSSSSFGGGGFSGGGGGGGGRGAF